MNTNAIVIFTDILVRTNVPVLVAIHKFCCLLLLLVIVHLPPEVFFPFLQKKTKYRVSTVNLYFYDERPYAV